MTSIYVQSIVTGNYLNSFKLLNAILTTLQENRLKRDNLKGIVIVKTSMLVHTVQTDIVMFVLENNAM